MELIGTFKHGKVYLGLYGNKKGKAGTENKHELPPPHDTILLFGDAYIAAYSDKTMQTSVGFTVDDYAAFYDAAFEGFDDLEEDESDGEGELSEDDEDVVEDEMEGEDLEEDEDDVEEVENTKENSNKSDLIIKGVHKTGGEDCTIEDYDY